MAQIQITSGTAPIKWDDVNKAFDNVNLNFNELYGAISTTDIYASVYSKDNNILVDAETGFIVGPIVADVNSLFIFGGGPGQVLSTDGLGNLSFVNQTTGGNANTGNITFTDNVIGSNNNAIIFQPAVIFNSTVQAEEFTSTSVGVPELFSETNLNLSAVNAVVITQSPLRLAQYTTTERNLITAQNGDIIYNTTDNKIQGYQNGGWVNLDGSGVI